LDELVLIAEIKSLQRNGFVSIKSFSNVPDRFLELKSAVIEIFGTLRPISISESIVNSKEIVLKFNNFNSAGETEVLLKCKLYVPNSEIIKLPENTYFIHDLVGCFVYKGDKFIGNLIDVLSLPANDAYIVKDKNENEIIIPATKDAVKLIDIDNKTVFLQDNYELIDDVED